MNNKIALLTLIDASVVLSTDEKIRLIDAVPSFTQQDVDTLGNYLRKEREFVLNNEDLILEIIAKNFEKIGSTNQDDKVYVGIGLPAQAGRR